MTLSKSISIMMVLFLMASISFAQGFSNRGDRGRGMGQAAFHESLNLSADQSTKLEDLRTAHQKKMVDLRADIQKIHIEKRELINSSDFDAAKLRSIEEKLMKSMNNLHHARIDHQQDLLKILDKDQQKKWLTKGPKGDNMGMGKKGRMGRGNRNCW
jgi:Spy/CpxP family protein refolding chaperone